MTEIGNILYPTDFSEHSLVALPLAMDLAKHYGARLHCLHVIDTSYEVPLLYDYVVPMASEVQVEKQEHQRLAEKQLDRFVRENIAELEGSVLKKIAVGKPFEQIISHARQEDIDLIVIGTHGHSALASMFLGSVAEKVIRKAPCAVLSVRHPEHAFKAP
jgi:nucleotide-binding universal stress UspA family protein